ncbi:hypothetical protein F5X97DRAFT_235066 [Nemania serpens]|nr:hypothetical protein F5X97DRAFT_235066 [Nemania serpens]
MKPVVGAMQAWSCVVISVFAILILSVIGSLYRSKHHEFVGSVGDPDNTSEVSNTIFTAVIVYACVAVSKACCTCARIDAALSPSDERPIHSTPCNVYVDGRFVFFTDHRRIAEGIS